MDELGGDTVTTLGERETDEIAHVPAADQDLDLAFADTSVEWPPPPPRPASPATRRAQIMRAISEDGH
jgi:hypothetical protein